MTWLELADVSQDNLKELKGSGLFKNKIQVSTRTREQVSVSTASSYRM